MGELTPIAAIKAKCLDCSGFSKKEVELCDRKKCPLYPYRLGGMAKIDSTENDHQETQA